jgi:drug/metabolite transporter (DMT)-like permease
MKTAAVLVIAIISQALGNVYVTKAMKAITMASAASGEDLMTTALRGAASPMLWLGTALLIVFFLLYSAALSWADLSFVLPATAFGYVLNVAAGHYFLNESISPARWVGSVIITLGVVCVSRSGVRTVEPAGEQEIGLAGGAQ